MFTHFHAFVATAALGAALIVAPDLAVARGCGGGGQHAQPQDDGGHQGRPGRRNRGDGQRGDGQRGGPRRGHRGGPDGAHDGPRRPHHGRPGHRGRPPAHRGPHGDITVGGYGYPGARIGPAAPGCAELAQRYRDLDRLFALRAQVEAEEKIVYAERGRMRVMDAGDIHEATALMGQEHQGNSDQTWEMVRRTRERLRDNSLAVLDQRIAATQQRANELAYQCQD